MEDFEMMGKKYAEKIKIINLKNYNFYAGMLTICDPYHSTMQLPLLFSKSGYECRKM